MTSAVVLPAVRHLARRRRGLLTLAVLAAAWPAHAANLTSDTGQAVTVVKANKACFPATVEVSGFLIPRDETSVRPDRPGAKVVDVMVDPGETVTQGQALAKLDGGTTVQAPVAGLVSASTAQIGAPASPKGEALFTIVARSEFDLVGQAPAGDLARLAVDQAATVEVIGDNDELQGKVRRVAPTVEPRTQLGRVVIGITTTKRLLANAAGRATIKTGESCGMSVPLTAVIYGAAGTIVQVVRRQTVETRRVDVGLISGGTIEIRSGLQDGDVVVARAGALLREGDPVRPMPLNADGTPPSSAPTTDSAR